MEDMCTVDYNYIYIYVFDRSSNYEVFTIKDNATHDSALLLLLVAELTNNKGNCSKFTTYVSFARALYYTFNVRENNILKNVSRKFGVLLLVSVIQERINEMQW